jgi:hypothetical protein
LRNKLEEQAKGKTKIRPAAVREWTPPRKSAIAIYASVGSLVGSLKEEGFEGDQRLCMGRPCQVDAHALYQLMQSSDWRRPRRQAQQGLDLWRGVGRGGGCNGHGIVLHQ